MANVVIEFVKLFIPRKGRKLNDEDLNTNFLAIQNWANSLEDTITVTAGGFYASLTGPGETTTPGALTQAGDLTVNSNASSGIRMTTNGTGGFSLRDNGGGGFDIQSIANGGFLLIDNGGINLTEQIGGNGITLQDGSGIGITIIELGGTANLNIQNTGTGGVNVTAAAAANITGNLITLSGNTVEVCTATSQDLSFFAAGPNTQQTVTGSRGGNIALASLLTALASYGLIVNSTTP